MRRARAHRFAPWLLACVSAASPGCTKKPTALVLAIGADPGTRASIDSVRVEVTRGGQSKFSNEYPLDPSGRPLPGTLTIVDDGSEEGPVRVDVIGTKADVERVRRRAVVGFSEGRTMLVRAVLQQDCVGVTCADVDSTCDRGACVTAVVDTSTLSEFTTNDDAIAGISGAGGGAGNAGAGGAAGTSGKAGSGGATAGKGGSAGSAGSGGAAGKAGAAGAGNAGAAGMGGAGSAGAGGSAGGAGSGGAAGSATFPVGLVHCWVGQNMGKDVVGGNDAVVHPDVKLTADPLGVGFECGPTAGPGTGVDAGKKPNLSSTGPWTFELFVQRKTAVSDVWVLDRNGSGLSLASLYVDASSKWFFDVRFSDNPAAPSALSAGPVPTGTWSHLALTWDGATFTTYNQGSKVAALPKASVPGSGAFAFDPPRWCGHPTSGTGFGGVVQAVRIWSRALTPAEVATVAVGDRSCTAL